MLDEPAPAALDFNRLHLYLHLGSDLPSVYHLEALPYKKSVPQREAPQDLWYLLYWLEGQLILLGDCRRECKEIHPDHLRDADGQLGNRCQGKENKDIDL
jgi:hypothetical protein